MEDTPHKKKNPSGLQALVPQNMPKWMQSFIAGGIAGTFAKSAIAPLERVKILFQIQSKYYPYSGILSTVKSITQKEGIIGLWKGNTATVARIFPYAAIQFLSFETYRKIMLGSNVNTSNVANIIAGGLAGATSVLFTYPLDVVRVRLAVEVERKSYTGIIQCIQSIFREQGVFGLYKGISPTLMGIIPYGGVNFSTFEFLKKEAQQYYGSEVIPIPVKLLCGGFAGAFGQTVTYPLDVVRRQMQTSGLKEGHGRVYKNTWEGLTTIVRLDGIRGLYRGISINFIRVGPQVSISFTTYEAVKRFLNHE